MIALLLGYICNATVHRIAKVEHDYQNMMELKKRAVDADVAKSQASNLTNYYTTYAVMYKRRKISLHAFFPVCSSWLRFHMRSELR